VFTEDPQLPVCREPGSDSSGFRSIILTGELFLYFQLNRNILWRGVEWAAFHQSALERLAGEKPGE